MRPRLFIILFDGGTKHEKTGTIRNKTRKKPEQSGTQTFGALTRS
jgi:hypothetical protein